VYSPDERYSLFYNLKQPTRTWDYGRLGSDRSVLDDVMFVISEGVTLNPFTNSGYSLLFVTTLAMFFFFDIQRVARDRQVWSNAGALATGQSDGLEEGTRECHLVV
jgi:hypothetical protein